MGKNPDTYQDPDKSIFNISSYNLNYNEKIVLSKGLGFAIPLKTVEHSEFLVPFEMLFTLYFSRVRSKLSNILEDTSKFQRVNVE